MATSTGHNGIDEAVAAFRRRLTEHGGLAGADDPARAGNEAADFTVARHTPRGSVAERVRPVHGTEDLAAYLAAAGRALTTEAVRKRAKQRRLVAFLSDDRQWLFPAWQFLAAGGRLVPHDEVVALWRRLPHGRWAGPAYLAMWMATPLRTLNGHSPADRARWAGADDPDLAGVVARLEARVAGAAA